MPPKFVWKILGFVAILCVLLVLFFLGYALVFGSNGGNDPNTGPNPGPTVNATAIAKYTPTPGPSSAQMATAVGLAKPKPYVEWYPGDANLLIAGLRDKAIVSEQDINIASQLSSPGEGHICIDLATWGIKLDSYCKINFTWTEWALAFKPQNIEVYVTNGAAETDRTKMPLSSDGTHLIQKAGAKVTIVIKDLGIVGPTTRFNQEFTFYKDVNAIWKLAIDVKQIFMGDDLRNKANELTQDTGDLAKADSFAPLLENGLRSPIYSDQLYAAFVDNLTTQGKGHIYNRLVDYATLVAKDVGYSGLESLTVIVPAKPTTPCDYVYAEDMQTLMLPREYCVYTYQVIGLTPDMKQSLKDAVKPGVVGVDYTELFKKLGELK